MNTPINQSELELTDEMVERNDEIDNGVYDLILTLTEKTSDELPWDMEMIGTVTDAVTSLLWERFKLAVRHPALVTNDDETQCYCEYDYESGQASAN